MSLSYEEIMENKNFLPFPLDHFIPLMVQTEQKELDENKCTRSSCIEQLRKLIIEEKTLKCRTDDEFLLQFLRARKFIVKKAFIRLQTLYRMMSKTFSDVYAHIEDERATQAFGSGTVSHIPYRDRDGAAVVFFKISNWKVDEMDTYSIMNCCSAAILSAVDYPATQVCGLWIMADVKGTTLQHMTSLSPRILKLISKNIQDTLPIRLKGIHIINTSAIFRYIWGILNIFLSEKMKKRVHFHDDNMESLHKFIPKEILPTEYGRENPNFDPIKQGSAELEKFRSKYLQIIHDGYKKN